MTTSSQNKRLDAVEAELSPKEWSIRFADQIRSYPSEQDYLRAIAAKAPLWDSVLLKPYRALADLAEKRHPGKKPEDIAAFNKLSWELATEYQWRKELILSANTIIRSHGELGGLRATLKLAQLEKIVLMDAFGRTARKAAEWIEGYKTADAEEEESRQGMMEELASYADLDFGEKWSDSIALGEGVRIRFPSVIEDWIADVVSLAGTAFAVRAAVQVIQDKYFDGHSVLYQDVEAGLDGTIKTLEEGIATFNAYLKTRADLFSGEWEVDEEENDGIASAIPGEREGRLVIDIAAIHAHAKRKKAEDWAAGWVKDAKNSAKFHLASRDQGEQNAIGFKMLREQVKP